MRAQRALTSRGACPGCGRPSHLSMQPSKGGGEGEGEGRGRGGGGGETVNHTSCGNTNCIEIV